MLLAAVERTVNPSDAAAALTLNGLLSARTLEELRRLPLYRTGASLRTTPGTVFYEFYWDDHDIGIRDEVLEAWPKEAPAARQRWKLGAG